MMDAYKNIGIKSPEERISVFNDCQLTERGSFNLQQMETVRSRDVAKIAHVEKQVYVCASAQGGVPIIV
ncbi:MAG: hypothetical protein HMLIMOIP_002480 [Candidatus Nitrosomirales archaeon]|jgi:hypothetical protein